ncbi:MAG: GHKL domain-containing protein [Butyrivibrio sp.]|nr:GHKL domain-containing protein [Butyrivibrio sp.]
MSEVQIRIIEEFYGVSIILIRGIFLYYFIRLFIKKEVLNRVKRIVLSAVITIEALCLYSLPFPVKGLFTIISVLTIIAIFYFYDKKAMPHMLFVFFLWQNIYYVWHLINTAASNSVTDKVIGSIDYTLEGAIEELWLRMFLLMMAQVIFMTVLLWLEFLLIKRICPEQYDMTWTEAVYLSIYSAVSYFISYMIVDVMVVPLQKEVFVLLDEKRSLRYTLPILAVLIFIGELSAIATWQRYRRLKEEDLLLQEQVQEQEFLRKKIEFTEKHHDQIRTLRHDMAGKLMILKSFIENNRYQDASDFLSEMDIELNASGVKYSTGNPVTDVVINEAATQAEKQGCTFECEFSYPEDKSISAMDMAIVLNNLLDNALEAVALLSEKERFIKLYGTSKDNFYLIKAENSYDGTVIRDKDSSIVSRKKEKTDNGQHGIGLKSVKNIAEKYLGGVKVETENNTFIVTVMLQSKEK